MKLYYYQLLDFRQGVREIVMKGQGYECTWRL